ncbi:hypothetical protein AgCh_020700 [Apium graveolens]
MGDGHTFEYARITANQGCYILELYYASPTLASAMQNSVPAITFVMASTLSGIHLNSLQGFFKNFNYLLLVQVGTSGKSLLEDGIDDEGFSTEAHGCAIIEVLGKDKRNEVQATLHKV